VHNAFIEFVDFVRCCQPILLRIRSKECIIGHVFALLGLLLVLAACKTRCLFSMDHNNQLLLQNNGIIFNFQVLSVYCFVKFAKLANNSLFVHFVVICEQQRRCLLSSFWCFGSATVPDPTGFFFRVAFWPHIAYQ